MSTYGQQTIGTTGSPIQVNADGRTDGFKHCGVTIDWSLITAVSADTTLLDGTIVKNGDKYIRYGTVLDLIGTAEVQTIDLSAGDDPTAGSFTLTYGGQTTAAIAWNASAAAVQTAFEALNNVEQGDAVVTKSGFVYTFTFASHIGNAGAITVGSGSLTGATSVTVTETTAGTGNGKYGPVKTNASDGRQAMARGESYILNRTVVYSNLGSDHPPVLEAGTVWQARLVTNEALPGDNNPTLANILTAFPGLRLAKDF